MLIQILSSSLLICIVLLIRNIFRRKVRAGITYALWGVVLLRLLVPVQIFALPAGMQGDISNVLFGEEDANDSVDYEYSVVGVQEGENPGEGSETLYEYNYIFSAEDAEALSEQNGSSDYSTGTSKIPGTDINKEDTAHRSSGIESASQGGNGSAASGGMSGGTGNGLQNGWFYGQMFRKIVAIIWASVAIILLITIFISNLHLYRKIKKNRVCLSGENTPSIYQTDCVSTPCLYGVFRPSIYFTPEVAESTAQEQEYIISHEKMHYRHRDYIWSVMRVLLVCVYWFNPLVWVAARISKRDAEFAADEAVTKNMGEEERIQYGKTILGTLRAERNQSRVLSVASTACSSKSEIKKRIVNISRQKKTSVMAMVVLVVLVLSMTACSFVGKTAADTGTEPEGADTVSGSAVGTEVSEGSINGSTSGITTGYENDKELDDAISEVLKDVINSKIAASSSDLNIKGVIKNVVESHMLLEREEKGNQVTAYVVMETSCYGQGRRHEEGQELTTEQYVKEPTYYYNALAGESGFCAITFEKTDSGYVKKEYWKSDEFGEKEAEEVRSRFPESISDEELDLTQNKYMEYLERENRKKALDELKKRELPGDKQDAVSIEKIKKADSVTIFTYDGAGYGYSKMNDPEFTKKLVDAFNQLKLVPVSGPEQKFMDLRKMIQLDFYTDYDLDRQIMFDENRICWVDGKPNAFVMMESVFDYQELMQLVEELEVEENGYTSPLTSVEITDWKKDTQLLSELFQDSPEVNGDLIRERADALCKIQGTTRYEEYRSQCNLFVQLKKMYLAAKEEGIEVTEKEAAEHVEEMKQSLGLFGMEKQLEEYCKQKNIPEKSYMEIVKMVYKLDFPVDKYMEKTNSGDEFNEQEVQELIGRQTVVVSSE